MISQRKQTKYIYDFIQISLQMSKTQFGISFTYNTTIFINHHFINFFYLNLRNPGVIFNVILALLSTFIFCFSALILQFSTLNFSNLNNLQNRNRIKNKSKFRKNKLKEHTRCWNRGWRHMRRGPIGADWRWRVCDGGSDVNSYDFRNCDVDCCCNVINNSEVILRSDWVCCNNILWCCCVFSCCVFSCCCFGCRVSSRCKFISCWLISR